MLAIFETQIYLRKFIVIFGVSNITELCSRKLK